MSGREVSLKGRGLSQIPVALQQSNDLVKLNLSDNSLTSLDGLARHKDLETIIASSNRLVRIAKLRPLRRLRRLDASRNYLTMVDLSGISTLTVLLLHHNHLFRAPDLSQHPHLQVLDISFNHLNTLESSNVETLESLRIFRCSNNKLKALPGPLPAPLEVLDISSNLLSSFLSLVQEQLQYLQDLQTLSLALNPFADRFVHCGAEYRPWILHIVCPSVAELDGVAVAEEEDDGEFFPPQDLEVLVFEGTDEELFVRRAAAFGRSLAEADGEGDGEAEEEGEDEGARGRRRGPGGEETPLSPVLRGRRQSDGRDGRDDVDDDDDDPSFGRVRRSREDSDMSPHRRVLHVEDELDQSPIPRPKKAQRRGWSGRYSAEDVDVDDVDDRPIPPHRAREFDDEGEVQTDIPDPQRRLVMDRPVRRRSPRSDYDELPVEEVEVDAAWRADVPDHSPLPSPQKPKKQPKPKSKPKKKRLDSRPLLTNLPPGDAFQVVEEELPEEKRRSSDRRKEQLERSVHAVATLQDQLKAMRGKMTNLELMCEELKHDRDQMTRKMAAQEAAMAESQAQAESSPGASASGSGSMPVMAQERLLAFMWKEMQELRRWRDMFDFRRKSDAATMIQKHWRGYRVRKWWGDAKKKLAEFAEQSRKY